MSKLFFDHALLPDGWAQNVLIGVGADGCIASVESGAEKPQEGGSGKIAVPGVANLHSHAFQRAMAGLGEWRGENDDSFWTWRDVMYRFLARLRPEDVRAIATQLYIEMLEVGFTAVGEFHYVHHKPDGTPYDNLSEMADQIQAASEISGIGLGLLPVFYTNGGFGGQPVGGAQGRFANDPEQFAKLVGNCRIAGRNTLGIAPHSLRAVTPDSLARVLDANPNGPVHIHVAEQVKEVEDCIAWCGERPVEWLLNHQDLTERWCLIHATHMTDEETRRVAQSGAVAGLCPITEANLGDGIFNGVTFESANGKWGVGSDSHIRIDLAEELRSLEYSQRLRDLGRNRMTETGKANGRSLFDAAAAGGALALRQNMGAIETGKCCDIVSLEDSHTALIGKSGDDWFNGWTFSGDGKCVRDVWVSGKKMVAEGCHISRNEVVRKFSSTMEHLLG